MGASGEAAHQVDTGKFDPAALVTHPIEEAVKFGPVGLIPHANGILKSIAKGIPDAAVMTLSSEPALITAHDIVNEWEEEVIADILYGYGEEQFSRRIACGILKAREKGEIKTTGELVAIIEKAVPSFYRNKKTHAATKSFQALRIAVNDELGALREGLEKAWLALTPHGRIAVITFHSIEDRIVKRFMREKASADLGKLVTKKPQLPSKDELKANPRSRSAKLRIIQKI